MKPIIAKLTRPRTEGIVERRRLFTRLDALAGKKIAWISAPAGSGKTTLAASWLEARKIPCIWYQADEGDADLATFFSYLGVAAKHAAPRFRTPLPLFTREYQSGVPTFTKRYFETLFGRLHPPFCFVIDNYQDVPPSSQFHAAVRDGLSTAPAGMSVVIISRSDPPPELSRLKMNGLLEIIKREELDFTLEESRELVAAHAKKKPSDDLVNTVFRKTSGWAAGLILFAVAAAFRGDLFEAEEVPSEQIYDFFATEVFERADDEKRTFLLMTAFLPRITARAADEIAGSGRSEEVLDGLSYANFFTERHATSEPVVYQYHPLFREFLLQRAEERFSQDEIFVLRKKAAMILEAEGQTEAATRLLIEAEDWKGLIELILDHAADLIATGRFRTLETWIDAIPRIIVKNNGWLLYWKASCRITGQPADARHMMESAYSLFISMRDPAGSFLSWAGIVNTFVYEWWDFRPLDRWIDEFAALRQRYGGFPSPEIEERASAAIFAAMMFRQPQHPELPHWTERVKAIMMSTSDLSHRMFIGYNLVLYYLWTGRITEAGTLVSMLSPVSRPAARGAPLPKLMWFRSMSLYYFYVSQSESGIEIIEQARRFAEETGVPIIDLSLAGVAVYHATVLGDAALAKSYLDRMAALLDQNSCYASMFYASQLPLVSFLQGNYDAAVAQASDSVRLTAVAGVPLILNNHQTQLLYILAGTGKFDQMNTHLAELRARASQTRSEQVEAWCLSCEAQQALHEGDDALFAERFTQMAERCRKTGLRVVALFPATLTRLCAKALELDIEPDFVKELIRLNRLVPEDPGSAPASWPYPLKVYTLGRFELLRDEKPVVSTGKVQQKPLAMLKALIALGGKNVSESQLIDALWPEAEGDAAKRNLDTTLHRLRKLLSDEEAILLQEGQVSLNNARVWTDAWGFERLLCRVEDMWKQKEQGHESAPAKDQACPDPTTRRPQPKIEETIRLTEKALALYSGHFLPGDAKEPWAISLRERLRSKFIYYTKALGNYRQESGRYDLAVGCYQRGIEIDDLAEELYQQIMICHHRLGQEAEVVKVYYRCRAMLHHAFGLEPSTKTREIYSSIRQNG